MITPPLDAPIERSEDGGLEPWPISPSVWREGGGDASAYLSNGVVGISLGRDPLQDTSCVLSGFSQPHSEGGYETHGQVPYPLGVRIMLGPSDYAEPFQYEVSSRNYDFGTGEFRTAGRILIGDRSLSCEVTTWCSRSLPHIVVQEIVFDVDIRVQTFVRTTGVNGRPVGTLSSATHWEAPGGDSVGIAVATERSHGRIVQLAAVVPARVHPNPAMQAARLLALAQSRGYETLRAENAAAWRVLWQNRVESPYPDGQPVVDAAFFYLNTSVHPSSPNSTGLCGLCPPVRYHNFNQHLFWDLEMHALPALLQTQPEAAKAVLEARFEGLPRARQNARMNGYRGAQFPWEAGTEGQEELPLAASAMLHEQHVTLCVAEAFLRAGSVFGPIYLRERTWPVVREVMEWLESRVTFDSSGQAHIRRVIGIGEDLGPHDDNVWTNALAKRVLQRASTVQAKLGFGPNNTWLDLAERLIWPIERGALVHHPGYELHPEFCPEQLMAIFPLRAPMPDALRDETLRQYLYRGFETMGMPMHSPYHWVWAKMARDEVHARKAFERGVLSFAFPPFNTIDEFGSPYAQTKRRVGPYLAHCGAILQGALYYQHQLKVNPA